MSCIEHGARRPPCCYRYEDPAGRQERRLPSLQENIFLSLTVVELAGRSSTLKILQIFLGGRIQPVFVVRRRMGGRIRIINNNSAPQRRIGRQSRMRGSSRMLGGGSVGRSRVRRRLLHDLHRRAGGRGRLHDLVHRSRRDEGSRRSLLLRHQRIPTAPHFSSSFGRRRNVLVHDERWFMLSTSNYVCSPSRLNFEDRVTLL